MEHTNRAWTLAALLAMAAGCLEPPDDDEVPLSSFFGDPDIEPNDTPHVEDETEFESRVEVFADDVSYLNGFADGRFIWYWNVNGLNPTFIAPAFRIIGLDDQQIGRTIIDVLPGDPGYSPWWRMFDVRVTEAFEGERIWSREAIDAGIRLGILEEPEETREVIDCPVVLRSLQIPVGGGETVGPTWVWYRNRRVHWVDFKNPIFVDPGVREMPMWPVYILQRINEPNPLYEFATQADITGDLDTNDSNNVFAGGLDSPRYSPLWYMAPVRVTADYPSIETSTSAAGIRAENELVDPNGDVFLSDDVVSLDRLRDERVNCPFQRTRGEL